MEKKNSILLDFDMGRKGYIEKMNEYVPRMEIEDSIKNDKEYFYLHYGIDLEKYKVGRKHIIPREMADLYCLMMVVMKLSPTYDQRE